MNAVQEKLYGFVMERVQEDKKEDAKKVLNECFARQENGSFNVAYLTEITPKLASTLKPGFVNELKSALAQFSGSSAVGGLVSKVAGGAVGSLFGKDKK